ncbi:MAG: DUF262 domain-containing protein [Deltaproteobacteria bacterium]|jgi:uncharacterized protein with ParB-like and HNH nuclease domain|nr:DUF262 domain-containing protein [Deltaproteobacteria bacterium]
MDAGKAEILAYLEGKKQFLIPVYQRPYSWGHEQCERLWNDITALHRDGRKGHFLGCIVRILEAKAGDVAKQTIIDGQQRLATVTVLLAALRDHIAESGSDEVRAADITESYLINPRQPGDDRYKLVLGETDQEELRGLVEGFPPRDGPESRIRANYAYFKVEIAKGDPPPGGIYEAVRKLQIVDVILERDRDEDPQAIFESLNSTGQDLADSDLIRNFVFMSLPPDRMNFVYDNVWRPTERLFSYGNQTALLDNFFRDWLTMQYKQLVNKNDVYGKFTHFAKNIWPDKTEGKDFAKETWADKTEGLCRDLSAFAKIHAGMDSGDSGAPELDSLYGGLKEIRLSVAYPFLMKASHDRAEGLLTGEELAEIVS